MCIRDRYEPTKNKLYLVVHSFGVKDNATKFAQKLTEAGYACLLYTSDAADERSSVDLGGRRIIKKKNI